MKALIIMGYREQGEMAEWSIAQAWKACKG